jgi:hypothetical protein
MANVSDLTRIADGEESEAYRFRSGSRTYVMRINGAVEGFEGFIVRRPNLPELLRSPVLSQLTQAFRENPFFPRMATRWHLLGMETS